MSSSLTASLPRPSKLVVEREVTRKPVDTMIVSKLSSSNTIPPYGHRKGWIPRIQQDFGDGGSFPEIHVAQFPLDMGRKTSKKTTALAIQTDAEGKIKYDVIVKQGSNKDKVVYHKLSDMLPSEVLNEDDPSLQKPDEDEINDITEKTRLALERLTNSKISAAQVVKRAEKQDAPTYVRYTPSNQLALPSSSTSTSSTTDSDSNQRIIRMVEVQKDPLEPPKFRINKKIPQAPPSPPPPVMHSPTRKVTVKEQQDWKVPPCISNWKNAKGYTIPLDKRMAADGRGLQQTHINEKFAKLSEALYIADRKAREEVEMRAQMEKKIALKEKEKKEEKLRLLAKKAREERAGIVGDVDGDGHGDIEDDLDDRGGDEEVREREEIRKDRMKERQREQNMSRAGVDKRTSQMKERERDISEQIALGVANPRFSSSEVQYDARLFNQNKGMSSGFGDDEDYHVYDKAWRGGDGALATNLYRPTRGKGDADRYGDDLEEIKKSRFIPDKQFVGSSSSSRRDGPVQFEKMPSSSRPAEEEDDDPLGLNQFLDQAKKASKRTDTDHHDTNRGSYKKSRPH